MGGSTDCPRALPATKMTVMVAQRRGSTERKSAPKRKSTRARPGRTRASRRARQEAGAAVRAEDAVKIYGSGHTAVRALDGVTVDIPAGRFTAIMGPSGSGKSTLMHGLAGLDPFTSGEAFIGDVRIGSLTDAQLTKLRREKVGFVFQTFNLLPTLTARENITLPLRLGGRDADNGWIDEVIDTVNLRERLGNHPSELSGGERQRVAMARALVTRPTVIFADEPTGNLDSSSSAQILSFLARAVSKLGQTVVMVTHDPTAAAFADSVLFLYDGRIIDRMDAPTARRVLNRMEKLGEKD